MSGIAKTTSHDPVTAALLYLLFLMLAPPASGAECVMRVAYAEDPIFSFKGQDGEARGADLDIVREGLRRSGCEARFLEMPWGRAMSELKSGGIEVLTGILKTEERQKIAYFSRPIVNSRNYLCLQANPRKEFTLKHFADLIGTDFRLGAEIDSDYGTDYQNLIHDPQFSDHVFYVRNFDGAWQMLAAGRLDGLVAEEMGAHADLQRLRLAGQIVKSDIVVTDTPDRVAFSRKNVTQQRVVQFDNALESMQRDGRYKQILSTYLPCPVSAEKSGCE